LMETVERYNHLGVNRYQGHKVRTSLLEKDYIALQSVPTSSGRIKLMVPTEKGFGWLKERGFRSKRSDKEGGIPHRYWERRLKAHFEKQGFSAEVEVAIGNNRAVDLVVSDKKWSIGIESETAKNSYEQMAENIAKCLEHKLVGVVLFLLDPEKIEKVRERIDERQQKVAIVSDENRCFEAAVGWMKSRGNGEDNASGPKRQTNPGS